MPGRDRSAEGRGGLKRPTTEREKMLAGLLGDPLDPDLVAARAGILRNLLGAIPEGVEIRIGFACGHGANILPGVSIGEGAVIATGTVVQQIDKQG